MRRRYVLIGFLLGLGAPAGALLIKWLLAGTPPAIHAFLAAETRTHTFFYYYLGVGTVTAFVAAAAVVGRIADRLAGRLQKLEGLGLRDPATGLLDGRYLGRRLRGEIDRANRLGHPLAWLVIKVEGYDSLVRRSGAAAAELAMADLAAVILLTGRDMDVLGRYEEDVLGLILPETGLYGAAMAADRIAASVGAARFTGPDGCPFALTVTVGGAEIDREICRVDQLVAAAAEALAVARREGPGGVLLHAPASRRGLSSAREPSGPARPPS